MTNLALNVFAGMLPRRSRQQLPPDGAELAVNVDLRSGDIRALHRRKVLRVLADPGYVPHKAFRVPYALLPAAVTAPPTSVFSDNDLWVTFEQPFSHFVRGPLVNDAYNRWYWTEEGQPPRMNTLLRLVNGDAPYPLGVPRPPDAPAHVVSASGGTSTLNETRCYTYTFVTIYGEESPPAAPFCAEGAADGTWTVDNMQVVADQEEPWASETPYQKKRIYRTTTGTSGGSFFFVADVGLNDVTYVDTIPTDEVSLNQQLESDAWDAPPPDLIGLVRHPNGFFAGFTHDNNLHFSVPYRPHAWPVAYVLNVEGKISALGVVGNSIIVATETHPYVCTGVNPAALSLTKRNIAEPCLSRLGVVTFPNAVVYPAASGLVAVDSGGVRVLTEQVVAQGEWRNRYYPEYAMGALYDARYLGISTVPVSDTTRGFVFAPSDPKQIFSEVKASRQTGMTSLQTDEYSGEVYCCTDALKIEQFSDPFSGPEEYQWKSLEFVTSKPINFGAYRIDFDEVFRVPEQGPEDASTPPIADVSDLEAWNATRFAAGALDTLNYYPLHDRRNDELLGIDPPSTSVDPHAAKQPIGGSPLWSLTLLFSTTVTVRLYGCRELRYEQTLATPGIYRLPVGYKCDLWQIEFIGNADIHHFKMAETGKELANV